MIPPAVLPLQAVMGEGKRQLTSARGGYGPGEHIYLGMMVSSLEGSILAGRSQLGLLPRGVPKVL